MENQFKGNKGEWKISKTGNSCIVSSEKPPRATYTDENWEYEKKHYGGYILCESIPTLDDANLLLASKDVLKALTNLFNLLEEHQPKFYLRSHYKETTEAINKALGKNK